MNFFEGLDLDSQRLIKEQMERFEKIRKEPRKVIVPEDKIQFPKGTLIHGTPFNLDTLKSISNSGIITGQYFGIEEDGETYYCADFHKVKDDQTLKEYNDNFPYKDGRCPFGILGKDTVALVIYPDKRMDEVTKYDCFNKDTEEGKKTRNLVNENGLPYDDNNIVSSILFGVPSNFINGIVLGDNVINKDNVYKIIEMYPSVFIARNTGEIIYKYGDTREMLDIRIDSVQKSIEVDNLKKEKQKLEENQVRQKEENQKMWDVIATLPIEDIVKVYEGLGWQGDLNKYATNLKK